jgi:hypothetical protein
MDQPQLRETGQSRQRIPGSREGTACQLLSLVPDPLASTLMSTSPVSNAIRSAILLVSALM